MRASSLAALGALLLAAAPVRAQKPVAPSPVGKAPVVAPAAPRGGMPTVITTPRLSFAGLPSGPVTVTTARISFAGAPPGGLAIATQALDFVGEGKTANGARAVNASAISFVGDRSVPGPIATDQISFIGNRTR
ncbi:MAG TPA: hypothetical protein VMT93_02915 [Gemmatimonadaceae bacterium]|nr:hypothetical protein [Gemmatimonadaceae bacterium]